MFEELMKIAESMPWLRAGLGEIIYAVYKMPDQKRGVDGDKTARSSLSEFNRIGRRIQHDGGSALTLCVLDPRGHGVRDQLQGSPLPLHVMSFDEFTGMGHGLKERN